MLEAIHHGGFIPSESGKVLISEERQRRNKELVIKALGTNYQKVVQDLGTEHGDLPKGHKLTVFENPDQHVYRTKDGKEIVSGSINLVEEQVGEDLIIVSFLLRDRKSSRHFHNYHPEGGEKYKLGIGSMAVHMDEELVLLSERNRIVWVAPYVVHQVEAVTDFAVPIIHMKNTLGVPREELHKLVE